MSRASLSCPRSVRGQGMIAFAARGRLELLDLATCRSRVLVHTNATDVGFSANGRWLAYSRPVDANPAASTGLFVVPARGGRERSPLGAGVIAWSWARTGDLLYAITTGGSLVSASPTGGRRVIESHLGQGRRSPTGLGLSPDGQRAVVDRSRCGPRAVGELDTIDLRTGARSVTLKQAGRFLTFAGWSPDGRWLLFWSPTQCSNSIAADGLPLQAVPATGGKPVQVVRHMLLFSDFLSWCGTRLIAAAGPDRETQLGSVLVETQPPGWRDHTLQDARKLSWVSPACAPSGRLLAAAAGPNTQDAGFGVQHRSIWLLRPNGTRVRRLTSPPARDLSDEAPRFSRDGRWILFIRTRTHLPNPATGPSISRDTIELVRTSADRAPVPIIDFTSNDFSYYDHFSWPDEIAWYQPH